MKQQSEKMVAGGFALALIVLSGVATGSYLSIQRLIASRQAVEHTFEVLEALEKVFDGSTTIASGRYGYLISRKQTYLKEYEAGVQATEQSIQAVRRLTIDNASQQRQLAELEPVLAKRMALAQRSISLLQQGQSNEATQTDLSNQGLILRQKVRLILNRMKDEERLLLQERKAATDDSVRQTILVNGVGYLVGFSLLMGVFLVLHKQIRIRRRAEAAAQKQSEAISDLYNHAPCGYHSLDAAGIFIRINDTELDWLGYTRDEVLYKRHFIELLTPESALIFQESFPRFKAQGWVSDVEFELIRKDGTLLPVSLSATAIRDAEGNFWMSRSTLFDISDRRRAQAALQQANEQLETRVQERTAAVSQVNALLHSELLDRKQAEQALSKSEKQLRTITNALPVLISYVDADRRYRFNNRAYEQWFGCDWTTLDGQHLRAVVGESAYQTIEPYVDAALSGQEVLYESYIPYKEGSMRWIRAIYIPDVGDRGTVKGYFAMISDITDRKLAEQALAESEKQLRLITDALPVLVSYVDADQRYRFNNQTYEQWYGQMRTQITGQHLKQVIGESAYQHIQPYIEAALSGQAITYESIMPYIDGGTRWIDATYIPDFGEQGNVQGFFALINDITDRKQAEEALRQSEERLHSVLQNMPVMLDAFDSNWNLITWNRECERVTGYQADEIVGNPNCMELLYPDLDYRQQMVAAWAASGNNYRNWEWDIVCKDGSVKTVSWSNISDEFSIPGWATWGIGVDVTDRKLAEAALRESEQRLSLAIEGSGMATWDINLQTGSALWSAQHFKLLGYEPVPSGQATLSMWQRCVHPDDLESVTQMAERAIQTRSLYRSEHRIRRVDNEQIVWLAAFGRCLYDRSGQASRFIGIILDISDRKLAEQALQHLNEALEVKVQERTMALKQLNEDLVRSNQELEQFAYIASHDLQEPLRAVTGYTQLLVQDYQTHFDASAHQYAEYIVDGAKRMQQLIQDLLYYSRVGTRDLVFTPTDCNVVLQQVLGNLAVAIAESHAVITSDPLPTVRADKLQLAQLLQNLIGNAIKFCRDGAPKVHISARREQEGQAAQGRQEEQASKEIQPSTLSPKPSTLTPHASRLTSSPAWLFSVCDNGIGIKPRYLERIFEIFKRLHTRTEFPGTGIGLAICKKIIDRHGGDIWAESQPGTGTTFYFTLPYYDHSDVELDRDSADRRLSQ